MRQKTRLLPDGRLAFWCPGCREAHAVMVGRPWTWNGDRERPTLTPSVLVTSGHYISGHTGDCWCTYNANHADAPASFVCGRCHSHVTDGKIAFLADCTHSFAGKTVELEEF